MARRYSLQLQINFNFTVFVYSENGGMFTDICDPFLVFINQWEALISVIPIPSIQCHNLKFKLLYNIFITTSMDKLFPIELSEL